MSMRVVESRSPATYEDLRALPEDVVGELVEGTLFASPRPGAPHVLAASALGGVLHGPFHSGRGGPGGWWILYEPEIHLGSDVLVPDLAGWRRSLLPEIPDAAFFDRAPDWVCEILSPSIARLDLQVKLPVYARSGVSQAWIANPEFRTLEVFRVESLRWTLVSVFSGSDLIRAEPFESVEIDLAQLWRP
jgi:Uma2 family endonuclease